MFKPLRDKILELAISGKLVPQLDSEPAVEQIGPAPSKDEEPFALPEKWKWVKLSSLGEILTGKTPPTTHQEYFGKDIPFITPGDIDDNFHITYDNRGVAFLARNVVKFVPANSVLMVCIGSVGKCGVADREVAFNQQINALVPESGLALSRFLLYAMGAQFFQVQAQRASNRTIISILNKTSWGSLWLPLPPLEEQRRIVAKLDDIIGNLERMDQAYTELSGPMAKHFKNLVLQQAISGQLVPQLDSEPAVEQIGLAPAKEDEPFALPKKWKWVKLKSIGQIIGGGTPSSTVAAYWQNPTVNWITPADLGANKGMFISSGSRSISQLGLENSSARLVPSGSVIYSSRAPIGHIAIASEECATNQGCKTFVPELSIIDSKWGFYVLVQRTPFIKNQASGTTFLEISGKKLGEIFVPLPPLEEQRRIVARIEELFGDVDKLLEWQQFA